MAGLQHLFPSQIEYCFFRVVFMYVPWAVSIKTLHIDNINFGYIFCIIMTYSSWVCKFLSFSNQTFCHTHCYTNAFGCFACGRSIGCTFKQKYFVKSVNFLTTLLNIAKTSFTHTICTFFTMMFCSRAFKSVLHLFC